MLARREETLIATVQFLLLPLSFMSVTFMPEELMPGWMRSIAEFNPLNWAVDAGRAAVTASPDWAMIGSRAGLLIAFVAVCGFFACVPSAPTSARVSGEAQRLKD